MGGLRGALCLIMVQTVVLDIGADGVTMSETLSVVKSSLALWTTGVVLCTLLINAPALGFVLRVTGLTKVSLLTLQSRDKARQQFLKFTESCIHQLQSDEDELLQVNPPGACCPRSCCPSATILCNWDTWLFLSSPGQLLEFQPGAVCRVPCSACACPMKLACAIVGMFVYVVYVHPVRIR